MSNDTPDLDSAYDLQTPDDSRRLYAVWADTYDSDFVAESQYELHLHTARAFVKAGGRGPVLDVGAGTGMCGQALANLGSGPIDATDISAEMLDIAMGKDVYRDAIEADVLEGIPVERASYAGVVSSGTFTHGHVGPDALDELLRVAKPGAHFALSINSTHYEAMGFADKLQGFEDKIQSLTLTEMRIYGEAATGDHKDDTAFIAVFRVED